MGRVLVADALDGQAASFGIGDELLRCYLAYSWCLPAPATAYRSDAADFFKNRRIRLGICPGLRVSRISSSSPAPSTHPTTVTTSKNNALAAGLPAEPSGGASGARSVSTPLTFIRKLGVAVLAATMMLIFASESIAATKYVAKTGSDANSGDSIGSAYLTIAKGLQNIGAGGTLYIAAGTYDEWINNTIPAGTSNAARTTVTTYGSDTVTVMPSVATGAQRVVYINGRQYINVKGAFPGKLIFDGTNVSWQCMRLDRHSGAGTPNNMRFENAIFRNALNSDAIHNDGNNIEFISLELHDCGSSVFMHGIYNKGNDTIMENCEIYNNFGFGIHNYSNYSDPDSVCNRNIYRNNRVYNNGAAGIIVATGDDCKIYNNLFYDNGASGIRVDLRTPKNTQIYNNTAYRNGTSGGIVVRIDAGTGTILRNNISYGNTGPNYLAEVAVTESNNLWDGTNPLFVSTTAGSVDFLKIQSGSPAKDAGTNTAPINTLVTVDHWYAARPQGTAYDIGAHEFAASGPAAPSSLIATTAPSPNNYRQINLSWTDNASNETGFRIERKKGAGGTYAEIATTGANVVTYSDSTCGSGTTYYYRVRAYNGSGNSGYSAEANATTVEITTGRQGHWKLDSSSGTTATDSSGNSNTGTLTGGPTWVAGKIGNGLNFDGVDDRVNVGSGATLDNLPALTFSAWIKADTLGEGGKGRIIDKTTGSAPVNGWIFDVDGTNQLSFIVDYTTTDLKRSSATNAITTGAWYHVAVTWTGSATATNIKFYVNGVETGYGTTTNGSGTRVNDGTASGSIGNDSTGARTFDGVLDDVRAYNRVLSTTEITAIYRAGL